MPKDYRSFSFYISARFNLLAYTPVNLIQPLPLVVTNRPVGNGFSLLANLVSIIILT